MSTAIFVDDGDGDIFCHEHPHSHERRVEDKNSHFVRDGEGMRMWIRCRTVSAAVSDGASSSLALLFLEVFPLAGAGSNYNKLATYLGN